MSESQASDILASALRDVDEMLMTNKLAPNDLSTSANVEYVPSEAVTKVYNEITAATTNLIANDLEGHYHGFVNHLHKTEKEIKELLARLQQCMKKSNYSSNFLYDNSKNKNYNNRNAQQNHVPKLGELPTNNDLRSNPTSLVRTQSLRQTNYTSEQRLHLQIASLQAQIQTQAIRIAQLELNRQQLYNTPDWQCHNTTLERTDQMSNNEGRMDLLTEVSKQHYRINSLEQTNRELEQKIIHLERELIQTSAHDWQMQYKKDLVKMEYDNQLLNATSPIRARSSNQNRYALDRQSVYNVRTSDMSPYDVNLMQRNLQGTQSTPPICRLADHDFYYSNNNLSSSCMKLLSNNDIYPKTQYNHYINEFDNLPNYPRSNVTQGTSRLHTNQVDHKSASLNELRHPRLISPNQTFNYQKRHNLNFIQSNIAPYLIPSNRKMTQCAWDTFPINVHSNGAHISDDNNRTLHNFATIINNPEQLLPPQYANNTHRKHYLNNRTRSPQLHNLSAHQTPALTISSPSLGNLSYTCFAAQSNDNPTFQQASYKSTSNNDHPLRALQCQNHTADAEVVATNVSISTSPPLIMSCTRTMNNVAISAPTITTTVVNQNCNMNSNKVNITNYHAGASKYHDRVGGLLSDCSINMLLPSTSSHSSTNAFRDQVRASSVGFAYLKRDFLHWDKNMISAWLYELGIGYCVPHLRKYVQVGQDLICSSRKTVQQLTGIQNPLHLKKLIIHMQLRTVEPICTNLGCITRTIKAPRYFDLSSWLDCIGLSSFTQSFVNCAVDCHVLDQLTLDDLPHLNISTEYHMLTLRHAIHWLRLTGFDLSKFCHKQLQECEKGDKLKPVNSATDAHPISTCQSIHTSNSSLFEVFYWTESCVIDWLRSIELSEYVAQLNGIGLHGALMILEDRFNPELLASILQIPQTKSLLRRHLSHKFIELIGPKFWLRKEALINKPDVPQLTIHTKIRHTKNWSFFKRQGLETQQDLVCPLDVDNDIVDFFISTPSATAITNNNKPSVNSESITHQLMHLQETDI